MRDEEGQVRGRTEESKERDTLIEGATNKKTDTREIPRNPQG